MNTITELTNIWVRCLSPMSTKEEIADALRDVIIQLSLLGTGDDNT